MRRTIIIVLFVLVVLVTILLVKPCLLCHQMPTDLLIGLLSSSIVVLLIEVISYCRDLKQFSYLKGEFKRIEIHNKLDCATVKSTGKGYEDITARYTTANVCPAIKIRHLGEGRFVGSAFYEEGKVKFDLLLDNSNPSHGFGTYQYTTKKPSYPLPDFGKYELFRDKLNNDRIYVYHQNIAPTKLTEGYEIWEKV